MRDSARWSSRNLGHGLVRVANDRERGLQFHHQSVAAKKWIDGYTLHALKRRARRVMLNRPGGKTGPGKRRSLKRWKVRKSEREKVIWDSEKKPSPNRPFTPATRWPGTNTVIISTETDWALLMTKFEERNEFYLVCGNIAERRQENCSRLSRALVFIIHPLARGPPNLQHSRRLPFHTKLSSKNLVSGYYFHNKKWQD